jgi:PAS domain S-box-containing protein
MLQGWAVALAAVAYLATLFAIAEFGDRRAWRGGRADNYVYALSLAVYCTTWTLFGSVGRAATHGFDFLAIYVGPVLVLVLAYPVLAKMLRVAKEHRVTSIADLIGSRYGRSQRLAALATLIATLGVVPYIALQLKAVTAGFRALSGTEPAAVGGTLATDTAFQVAVLMAIFAILFGVRQVRADERRPGMVLAIAFESLVKLGAVVAVGLFVLFGVHGGPGDLSGVADRLAWPPAGSDEPVGWTAMAIVSALAFLCLPRQFHVAVVENTTERHLATARWLVPVYLVAINLFVVPIALAGLDAFPTANVAADSFVITVPLAAGSPIMALVAFVGGLSAATAMVIVETVALSTMISNDIIVPLVLRARAALRRGGANFGDDLSGVLIGIRRGVIVAVLLLAYGYHSALAGPYSLSSIGLISFVAVAQLAPAAIGGLYWRRGTRRGATAGLWVGLAAWSYTMVLPSFGVVGWLDPALVAEGPFGISWLRPHALFGLDGLDAISHGALWSLSLNLAFYAGVSLSRPAGEAERRMADAFVDVLRQPAELASRLWRDVRATTVEVRDLVARFIGADAADRAFAVAGAGGPRSPAEAAALAERILSGVLGGPTARVVMAPLLPARALGRQAARAFLDEASEAITLNRDLLRRTLDSIDQGIGVFDAEENLAAWNARFLELLGLDEGLAQVGRPLASLVAAGEGAALEPARKSDFDPRTWGPRTWERRRRDGAVLEIRANPMPDRGFVVTVTDVTARVAAAEALRESERRIRVYTDNVPALIAYADREERWRFTNRPYEMALGMAPGEAIGRSLVEGLGPDRYGRLKPMIDRVLGGEPQRFEIEFPVNDQRIEWAVGTYIPHRDADGEVLGFFTLYQDISERRRAEAALREAYGTLERRVAERTAALAEATTRAEEANRGKTRFLAAAGHDLVQPLNAARLFAAALAERPLGVEERALVGRIDGALHAVDDLLAALLDISKLDAGGSAPSVTHFPVDGLLDELGAEFGALAKARGLSFRRVRTDAWVASDPAMLRRILQNFLSNAVRYTARGGIVLGCRRAGESVRIEVWDTGPGIPDDQIERIFDEFQRLDVPAHGGDKGLGLGLAIVERLGRTLGHEIGARSRVGRGSVFSVTVPRAVAAAGAPLRRAVWIPGQRLEGARVLVVDNEPAVLDGMAALLEGWGCVALAAHGPDEAHAYAAAPDLLLVDYHLDDGADGLALVEALRARYDSSLPAVLVTADRTDAVRDRAASAGVAVLAKPVRAAQLRALVNAALDEAARSTRRRA